MTVYTKQSYFRGLNDSGVRMKASIVWASCAVWGVQVSNVIPINDMGNLAFETVSAHPSFCHAFSRMSLRFCKFLGIESLMSYIAKKENEHLSRILPHMVNSVKSPDLREPCTHWGNRFTSGLDTSSPSVS
jgi:hypothetical protein